MSIKNKKTIQELEEIKEALNLSNKAETINYLIGFYKRQKKD